MNDVCASSDDCTASAIGCLICCFLCCVGIGAKALEALTTGDENTAVGARALYLATIAEENVAMGYDAGSAVTTGIGNTILGYKAGDVLTTGDNNIVIGHEAAASSATVDNEITLGYTAITKFRVPGLNSFEINDSGQFSGVASTASGTAGVRKITASTNSPSGGADGDLWVVYS